MSATAGADGRIYAIGGGRHHQAVRTVEAYDPATDAWSRVAPLGIARRGPGAVLGSDGRIYAIGGYDSQRQGVTTVEAYDPATGHWEPVAPMKGRHALNEVGAARGPDGRIYAVAVGTGSVRWPVPHTLEAYDTSSDTWTPLRPPEGSYYDGAILALVAAVDGRIYVLGAGSHEGDSVIVEAYDPARDDWQRVESPRHPRGGFGAAAGPDGRIYMIGGGRGRFDLEATVEAYDPWTFRWEPVPPLPTPRYLLTVTAGLDGRLFAIGGVDDENLLAHVETYTP